VEDGVVGGRAKGSNLWYRRNEYESYKTAIEAEPRIRGKPRCTRDQNQAMAGNTVASPENECPWHVRIASTSKGTSWVLGLERHSKKKKVPEGSDLRRGSLRCKGGN
jgi:hypothetical protein